MIPTTTLGIYLNDHLAGATGGVELIRRIESESGDTEAAETIRRLAVEIAEDRESLKRVMTELGIPIDRVRVALGWVAEKLARLKTNGRLVFRSPLSALLELEAMRLGVEGKICLWRSLITISQTHPELDRAELVKLAERGRRQADELETLRIALALERLDLTRETPGNRVRDE
jgi:hypothetical protein